MLERRAILDAEHVALVSSFSFFYYSLVIICACGLNEELCLRGFGSEEVAGQDV